MGLLLFMYVLTIREPVTRSGLFVDPNGHVRREPWRDGGMIHDFVERGDLGDFHSQLLSLLLRETPPRSPLIQIRFQIRGGAAAVAVIHDVIRFRWPAEKRSPPWTGFLSGRIGFSDGSGRCTDRRESGAGDDCSHCNGSWEKLAKRKEWYYLFGEEEEDRRYRSFWLSLTTQIKSTVRDLAIGFGYVELSCFVGHWGWPQTGKVASLPAHFLSFLQKEQHSRCC